MKQKRKLAAIFLLGLIVVAILSAFYGATRRMASNQPEYSPERYVLIQEYVEDSNGEYSRGRMCLYDVVSEQIIEVGEDEIKDEAYYGYDVLTEDYERIISGDITPEEVSALKGLMEEEDSEE